MLLLHLALTSAYSWVLKRARAHRRADPVAPLTRCASSPARWRSGSPASSWLLAFFRVHVPLPCALVKRCAELVSLEQSGEEDVRARARLPRSATSAVLWPLGVGSALSAVVVFGLFISADETRGALRHARAAWLVALGPRSTGSPACGSRPRAARWTTILRRARPGDPGQPDGGVLHDRGHAGRAFLLRCT